MHFASPIPWWLTLAAAAAIAASRTSAIAGRPLPLSRARRWTLTALRALCDGGARLLPLPADRDAPAGRHARASSCRFSSTLAQHAGRRRQMGARASTAPGRCSSASSCRRSPTASRPSSSSSARRSRRRRSPADVAATARQTDLGGASPPFAIVIAASRSPRSSCSPTAARHGGAHGAGAVETGPPVFAVGVGSTDGGRDREVIGISAGDPRLDQTSVDLRVSARVARVRPRAASICACSPTAAWSRAAR